MESPRDPLTGQKAFFQMYVSARMWASDVQPLRLESIPLDGVVSEGGKYGAWRAVFVSPSRGLAATFTYSIIEAQGNLHEGIFQHPQEAYSKSGQAQPFHISAFKVDSDEAFKTALEESADYVKRNPDKPVSFLLEANKRFPTVTWRVIWGESVGTSDYSVYVDANTGNYLQTMR